MGGEEEEKICERWREGGIFVVYICAGSLEGTLPISNNISDGLSQVLALFVPFKSAYYSLIQSNLLRISGPSHACVNCLPRG